VASIFPRIEAALTPNDRFHERGIEMMFGGVTRTLLKLAPVPLLMSR